MKPITPCSICGTTGHEYQISSVKLRNPLYRMSRGAVLYIKMPGKSRTQLHIEKIKGIKHEEKPLSLLNDSFTLSKAKLHAKEIILKDTDTITEARK
jgi:hypothetical protein